MPYFPVAQIPGAFGLSRGPGAYLALGDAPASGYSAVGSVYATPPGTILAVPGATGVSAEVGRTMARQAARGAGHAGTRGMVTLVPNSQVPSTSRVNRYSTPAASIDRTTEANRATGPVSYEVPGATRKRPGGKGLGWWYGAGISRAAVRSPRRLAGTTFAALNPDARDRRLGDDIVRWAHSTSADADRWWAANGAKYGAEFCKNPSAHVGKHGKDRDFVQWCAYFQSKGLTGGGSTTTNTVYDAALGTLQTFVNGLMAGSVPHDSPLPSGIDTLSDPGAGQPGKSAYDQIRSILDTQLALARQAAKYKQYTPPVYTPPADTGASDAGAGTTTTDQPSSGGAGATITNLPTGGGGLTYIPPGSGDPYSGGETAGATYVPGAASTPPITATQAGDANATKATSKGSTGLVAGGVVVLGLAAFFVMRRRKKRA